MGDGPRSDAADPGKKRIRVGSVFMTDWSGARVRAWFSRAIAGATLALAAAIFATPAQAAVGINKSFVPNSVTAGQVSVLNIVLLNPNAAAATGVTVTDTLPANVVVANPLTPDQHVRLHGHGDARHRARSPSPEERFPASPAAPRGSASVSINVVSSLPNTYLDLIPANAVTSSQGTNAQLAQATLVVSAPANITGSKSFRRPTCTAMARRRRRCRR